MAQQNKQSQFQQPNPRTTIISVILFMIVAFFVGQQFMAMSSAGTTQTDRLITSEFVQAVEQDRVTKVVYSAGDDTVSGSYYRPSPQVRPPPTRSTTRSKRSTRAWPPSRTPIRARRLPA